MAVFFITGTSGAGKSILTQELKKKLSSTHYAIHDFDEVGVPPNPDKAWRERTTHYWIKKVLDNTKHDLTTIISGVSVPAEIEIAAQALHNTDPIYFGCISINDSTIQKRLTARHWNEQLIKDNIAWGKYLEDAVRSISHSLVLESTHLTPREVADRFIEWITYLNKSRNAAGNSL
jgi:hypothetical protein